MTTSKQQTALLRVEDLEVVYGVVEAVRGVSIEVRQNQVVALLGANGAGKTSTVNAICGAIRARAGRIKFGDADVSKRKAYKRARAGLVMVPEGRKILSPLSVEDNLLLGGYGEGSRRQLSEDISQVFELFPVLRERRKVPGGLLSGGEQQMLALGRALMSRPKLIVMDEPTMGLAPIMVDAVMEKISAISELGVSVLMIEQNAAAALPRCSWVYVLDLGRIVFSGTPGDASTQQAISEAFLGEIAS